MNVTFDPNCLNKNEASQLIEMILWKNCAEVHVNGRRFEVHECIAGKYGIILKAVEFEEEFQTPEAFSEVLNA